MFDAMLSLSSYVGTRWLTNGELAEPMGTAHEYTVPWEAFETKEGYLVIATRQDKFWVKFCEAYIGLACSQAGRGYQVWVGQFLRQ